VKREVEDMPSTDEADHLPRRRDKLPLHFGQSIVHKIKFNPT
jgi:hypothetical protein